MLAIERGKPADGVLKPGDRIVAVDGQTVTVTSAMRAIASPSLRRHARPTAAARPRRRALTVRRAGRTLTLSVYPRYNARSRTHAGRLRASALRPNSSARSPPPASRCTRCGTRRRNMLTGHRARVHELQGAPRSPHIVGIAEIAHEAVADGAGYGLVFLGLISLILAVINLFPFLPLDGGHVAWSLAEKLRGTADLGRRDVALQLGRDRPARCSCYQRPVSNDISRLGGCGAHPRSTAPRTPSSSTQRARQPARALARGPNSASISARRSSSISSHSPAAPSRQ